jgi:hypothetical protein
MLLPPSARDVPEPGQRSRSREFLTLKILLWTAIAAACSMAILAVALSLPPDPDVIANMTIVP